MEIFSEPHGLPGLRHGDRDLVLGEDVLEHDGRRQDILVHCGPTPVQHTRLHWTLVRPGKAERHSQHRRFRCAIFSNWFVSLKEKSGVIFGCTLHSLLDMIALSQRLLTRRKAVVETRSRKERKEKRCEMKIVRKVYGRRDIPVCERQI